MLVIPENRFNINEYKGSVSTLEFVKKVPVVGNLLDEIVNNIHHDKLGSKATIDTQIFLITAKYVYQLCYVLSEYADNPNNLAIFLSPNHTVISGNVCLLKFTNTNPMNLVEFEDNEIQELVAQCLYHVGLIVKPNGTVKEFNFANEMFENPSYKFPELEKFVHEYYYADEMEKSVIFDHMNIMGYILEIFFHRSNDLSSALSEVSKWYGKNIYGDVLIVFKLNKEGDSPYGNITKDEYTQLSHVVQKIGINYDLKPLLAETPELNNRFLLVQRALAL